MRIIKGTLFLLLMVITLSSCSVETKPDNNIVLNSKQIENSNPIFEFLNTVETKRFISEIQTNPLAYAEITFTDKDKGEIFRTAISNNTEIINVYKALSEILVADEESEEDIYSGVSYTWFFDIRQGYPYEITIYENCIMHNGKYYSLYNTNYFINLTRLHINNDRPSPNQK